MSADLKDRVLAALEQACRKQVERWPDLMMNLKCDEGAARYGALTPHISRLCGVGVTMAQVRRVLHAEVAAGRVLLHRPYPCTISWWPVGLWETLQQESSDKAGAQ